jgi:hypothetical protein
LARFGRWQIRQIFTPDSYKSGKEMKVRTVMKLAKAGLAKVEVAPQTPVCPNEACGSLAVRLNPDGSGRCNQCGQTWPSPNGDPDDLGAPSRGDLIKHRQ